jgi:hypothetical protein
LQHLGVARSLIIGLYGSIPCVIGYFILKHLY